MITPNPTASFMFVQRFVDSVAIRPFYDDLLRLKQSAITREPPDDPNEARMPVLELAPLAA